MAAGTSATLAVVGSEIRFGATPVACGAATTTNTDAIAVTGGSGTTETLTIDQPAGAFAPGVAVETGTGALSEIEIAVSLGDATDGVVVLGTAGNDSLTAGTNGVSVNADSDVDLTFSVLPAVVDLRGGGGQNTLSGRGGSGAGSTFPGQLLLYAGDLGDTLRGGLGNDELRGGAGADTLDGREGDDLVLGDAGNDALLGGTGDDSLTGGAGADTLTANDGTDTIRADDDEADTSISGGSGTDTVHYDEGLDLSIVGAEIKIPA